MSHRATFSLFPIAALLAFGAGCGASYPAPTARMADSESAVRAAQEVGGLAADTWKVFRKDFPKRAGRAASIAISGGIGALLLFLGQDIAALATAVTAFLPINQAIKELQEQTGEDQRGGETSEPVEGGPVGQH